MKFIHLTLLAAAALLSGMLTSCSTSIPMTGVMPSHVSYPKGSWLGMGNWSESSADLWEAVADKADASGYYVTWMEDPRAKFGNYPAHAMLYLSMNRTTPGAPNEMGKVQVNASLDGFSKTYSEYVYNDRGTLRWESAYNEIAEELVRDITPHTYTYKEYVKGNDENPAVDEGAKACASGDWARGLELAKQAIANKPDDAEAHYLMGLIHRYTGDYAKSSECFAKANSLTPGGKYANAIEKNGALQRNEQKVKAQLNL